VEVLIVVLLLFALFFGAPIALAVAQSRLRARLDQLERRLGVDGAADGIARLETRIQALQADLDRLRRATGRETVAAPAPAAAPAPDQPATGPTTAPDTTAGAPAPRLDVPPERPEETIPSAATLPPPPPPFHHAHQAPAVSEPAPAFAGTGPFSSPPVSPGAVAVAIGRVREWLFGGNTVVRAGVIVLFFGVAFFLNYAIEQGWVPIELRLSAAAAGGIALVGLGWRLRRGRADFALALQGGGVGIVYLTVFAAVNLYALIDAALGMPLMVVLVALASTLAVLQDSRGLAVLATAGGFLAPVLVSSGGTHVGLFGYYLALDVGILAIAWFKAWRVLNVLGFLFTFAIGSLWGARFYRPEHFASTEPFLIAFFLLYVAVPILFASRTAARGPDAAPARKGPGLVDGTLVFGVPLVTFALQHALVRDTEYGLAFTALAMALLYATLGTVLWRRRAYDFRLLVDVFVALSVGFGTIAIPLAVDARWTGAAWALEGAGLVWVGVRQRQMLARFAGLGLQLAAAAAYVRAFDVPAGDVPILNGIYIGALLISLAGFFSGWHLRRTDEVLSIISLWWGLVWWFGAGFWEITTHEVPLVVRDEPYLLFAALSLALAGALRVRLEWRALAFPGVLLLAPVMVLAAVWSFANASPSMPSHPMTLGGGLIAWVVAFAAHAWLLRRVAGDWPNGLTQAWHAGALWLAVFLASWELAWAVGQTVEGGEAWSTAAWAAVAVVTLASVPALVDRARASGGWPLGQYGEAYVAALWPIAILVQLWLLATSAVVGDPSPLPYVPLANPLELMQAFALVVLLRWPSARWTPLALPDGARRAVVSGLAFIALNGVVARAVHVFAGVRFSPEALWDAASFQTAVSITWTLVALAVMAGATRLQQRSAWIAGAVLLGAVVVKLFAVDLDGVGTIARFVSFIVVGLLMLLIGYLSPLPPRPQEQPS
jgi:uncharacterized membrane protein